jgi:hypothetical protein
LEPLESLAASDESIATLASEQQQRVRTLFHRQANVPLIGLQHTQDKWIAWERAHSHEPDTHFVRAFEANIKKLQERMPFEQAIIDAANDSQLSELDRVYKWLEYITFEQKCKAVDKHVRSTVLFERAIAKHPLALELWHAYCMHMDQKLETLHEQGGSVHERSVRNCSWSGKLWVLYLRVTELLATTGDAEQTTPESLAQSIEALKARAVASTLSAPIEYWHVYEAYLDFQRRKFNGMMRA